MQFIVVDNFVGESPDNNKADKIFFCISQTTMKHGYLACVS